MHMVATLRPPRRLRLEKDEEALITKGSITSGRPGLVRLFRVLFHRRLIEDIADEGTAGLSKLSFPPVPCYQHRG
jgi:hypothetical protein